MPTRSSFDYAIVRVMPRVERGEQLNAGVILHCRACDFLGAEIALDGARLLALDPTADVAAIERALALIPLTCSGDPRSGPIGRLPLSERFHWLTSPRSTVTQTSPVHSGLCDDPVATLHDLVVKLVLTPR